MRAQVSEVFILTQLARKIYRLLRLLVPPSIIYILVIVIIIIFIPTLMIIFPFFLFLLGCWLPFGFDDCTKSTSANWVGSDEAVAFPNIDWLSYNWLTCFVT